MRAMATASPSTLTILVVDDHPTNRLILAQQLLFLGYQPQVAADGASAIELWLTHAFDVVILDCNMPEMDGYDVSRAIRQHETRLRREPCVLFGYTANAQAQERERCQQAGMDDCLFKPLDLSALGRRLRALSQAAMGQFDAAALYPLTGGNPQLMERMLAEILRSCRNDRIALQALDGAGSAALLELTHRILGAARMVGAHGVTHACEQLEADANNASPQALGQLRSAVISQLQALEQRLQMTPTYSTDKKKPPA